MTTTLEDIDLSFVTFTDEDPEVSCIWGDCDSVAVGALITPACGRHPCCAQHLAQWKSIYIDNLFVKGKLTITCGYHPEVGANTYNHNPLAIGPR